MATGLVLALAALSAGLAVGPAATAATTSIAKTIYVNGETGIDIGGPWTDFQGCGSSAHPCASISYGLRLAERVPAGDPNTAVVIRVAPGTYVETLTVHVPRHRLVIEGTGTTVIDGGGQGSTVRVQIGDVTLRGLTITGGDARGDGASGVGGGLYVAGEGRTVVGDTTWDGNGNVTVTDSTITGNQASLAGAGVANLGFLTLTRSTVTANGPSGAYAVFNASYLTINSSTIAANLTSGAIVNAKSTTVRSSTVSGGSVDSNEDDGVRIDVADSILSGSTCEYLSGRRNVVTDPSCMASDTTLSTVAGIGLAPLAANGSTGPQTMAIDEDSAAHLRVPKAKCDATDQRGQPRPGGGDTITSCDAGAYELQYVPGPPPTVPTSVYVDAAAGSDANTCLTAADACESIATGLKRAGPLFGDSTGVITVHVAAGTYDEKLQIDAPGGRRLTIAGAGAARTVVKGAYLGSVITVGSGEVELNGLTITGGASDTGGGLNVGADAVVDLVDSAVTDHHVAYDSPDEPYYDSVLGGGIQSLGTLSLIRSTVSGNSSQHGPGAIYSAGPLTITESTIADNDGHFELYDYHRVAILALNRTTITSSTISSSSDTLNIATADHGVATVSRSILSGGICSSVVYDAGYNVVTDRGCVPSDTRTVSTVAGIGLEPLAANGSTGPQTMAIHLSSAAHLTVPRTKCDDTDQRGQSRPGAASASHCDAGAYELLFVPGAHFYVNASTGVDTFGCRAPASACRTVKAAMARVDLSFQGGISDIEVSIAAGTYTGTVRADPPAGHILSIQGSGAQSTVIDGRARGSTLTVGSGEVDVRGLTLTGGHGHNGGGLFVNDGAKARLTDAYITGNSADYGGGIFSYGPLNVTGSTISGNKAYHSGEALTAYGQVGITKSTIAGDGAKPLVATGTATIASSTLSGGRLTGPMTISRSILSGVPCTGVIDGGYNVVSSGSCGGAGTTMVSTVEAIGLVPLAANGSAGAETMAIDPTSSAHLTVPRSECDPTDQRGMPRPGGGASASQCDAGAYELQFTPNRDAYVDAATGSDTNDCLTAVTACRTVTAGVARARQSFESGLTIASVHVAAGRYAETVRAELPPGDTLHLQGAGAQRTVVDGHAQGTTLTVGSGEVNVRGLTLTGGHGHNGGGLLVNDGAKAQLTDTFITGNTADQGGGIFSYGTLSIASATISDNHASGTAVVAFGQTRISTSTIVGDGSHLTITVGGVATITASTISHGSIRASSRYATLAVSGSILRDVACIDVTDGGYNVASNRYCVTADSSTTSTMAGIGLAPLAYYGGPTPTMPPASDSTAVQPTHRIPSGAAGCPTASSPGADQRGVARPVSGGCDVGAVELIASSVTVHVGATTVTASVASDANAPAGQPVPAGTVTFTDDGATMPGCAAVALADGTATCPHRAAGTVTVSHTSHNSYRASSASAGTVTRVITPGSPMITVSPVFLPVTVPIITGALLNVPDQTVPGQPIVVLGSGFAPNSLVVFGIYSTATQLSETTAGVDGTVSATLTIPTGFVGAHTIVAAGTGSDGAPVYLAARTIVGAAPDTGDTAGPPTSPRTIGPSTGSPSTGSPSTGSSGTTGGTTATPANPSPEATTTTGGARAGDAEASVSAAASSSSGGIAKGLLWAAALIVLIVLIGAVLAVVVRRRHSR